ncbi:substrate-binding domain-containing protein [Mediterraneibacter massiliensis]|uniref:substrate-binding domain-containing protein n=1 Tax=Mediterraneibacter massiliensis TaxID=1720300 RepID=UPI0022E33912|nr:substrate-binding domain-containing protein [Mediterraneibacter massiliensis]
MKKKSIAAVLISTLIVSCLAGCGQKGDGKQEGTDKADSVKVGVSIFNKDQFFANQEKEMLAYAENFPELEITSFDAQNDMQKQQEHIRTFASQNYDAIILSAVNTDTAAEMIDMAGDIPMIFTNRLPDESVFREGKDAYVGSDETESGKLQGEYLAEYYKDSGKTELNVVILMGQLGLDNTTKRTTSAKQALEDAGYTLNIVFEDTAEWDRATAMSKMEQVLGTGKPIDCVIANNDEMALGAIEALKAVDKLKDVQVVGLDATDNALQAIKDGEMGMTVFQDAKSQAEKAIDVAMKAANGEEIETMNWIPFTAITKENVDSYMK